MLVLRSTYNELAHAFDELEQDNDQLARSRDYYKTVLGDLKRREVMARSPYTGEFEKVNLEGL